MAANDGFPAGGEEKSDATRRREDDEFHLLPPVAIAAILLLSDADAQVFDERRCHLGENRTETMSYQTEFRECHFS